MRLPKIAVKVAIVENENLIEALYIIQCITREHEKAPKGKDAEKSGRVGIYRKCGREGRGGMIGMRWRGWASH